MKKFWNIFKSLLFISYLLGIFFLLYKNSYISFIYNLPPNVIPFIAFLSLAYFIYKYIRLQLKTYSLENEFSTIVNHTFRTPLTRIMWIAKELEKDMSQNERLLSLQNLTNATSRVLEIVDLIVGIKDIKNSAGYFFEAVSIRTLVEKSMTSHREEINKKGISFTIPTFNNIPLLTVDLKKISFVIDSVVENAIFYTQKDGKIAIDCKVNGGKMTISITDNGIGLSFMDKMRIFSRFYRSKEAYLLNTDGMGLRLYLSKQIIERHHGKIYAISKGRNKGTTFKIELPFNKNN